MKLSDISVIITTYIEEKNIRNCINSIPKQCEVIVVDNYSTDRTKELCHDVIFIEQDGERAKQRNAGLLFSSKPYILFLDADMSLEDGLLRECLNSRYRVLYIPERNSLSVSLWFSNSISMTNNKNAP